MIIIPHKYSKMLEHVFNYPSLPGTNKSTCINNYCPTKKKQKKRRRKSYIIIKRIYIYTKLDGLNEYVALAVYWRKTNIPYWCNSMPLRFSDQELLASFYNTAVVCVYISASNRYFQLHDKEYSLHRAHSMRTFWYFNIF